MNIYLQRFADGTFIDWGRNGTGKHRGYGGAKVYTGEAAKVMTLVIEHSRQDDAEENPS